MDSKTEFGLSLFYMSQAKTSIIQEARGGVSFLTSEAALEAMADLWILISNVKRAHPELVKTIGLRRGYLAAKKKEEGTHETDI